MKKKRARKILSRSLRLAYWGAISAAVLSHFFYYGVLPKAESCVNKDFSS